VGGLADTLQQQDTASRFGNRRSANDVLTNLYSFSGTTDGTNPYAGLVRGNDGNLYGTTSSGGTNNLGTVFKISSNGALTRLCSFNGTNGAAPYGALVQGPDGSFYGTTCAGGASNSPMTDPDEWDGHTHVERGGGTKLSSAILG
jgi:uncharacterized repeat protein (TIGR03803 family)